MYGLFRVKKGLAAAVLCVLLALTGVVCLTASAAENDKVRLPVIMYHSVLKDPAYLGKYVISPDELERDMQFLKAQGYTAVGSAELEAYVRQGVPLPEKPVMLSFDDGYYNNYLYAYPLAKAYGIKIVIAPIGFCSQQYTDAGGKLSGYYAHCTWPQIEEMAASGYVEFANHTYNLHRSDGARLGAKQLKGESDEDYAQMLTADVSKMQEKLLAHTGKVCRTFVYPFGAVSKGMPKIIDQMGFSVGLSCEERISTVTRDPDSLKMLGRHLRSQDLSVEKLLGKG